MFSRIPSVKDTYFQHKVLTRIHGTPTYESLQVVLTELKANASSVPSTLGAGQHGHLGLILSAARYAALDHTLPWVTPGNPGPFVPPANATGPQIEAAKDVWRELHHTFEICQATEKALIAQLIDTIDPIYLRALLNRATGQYSTSIRAIILHLFNTHGNITPQQVKAKEIELYGMHFDISQPVDTVFSCIDDLADLADHAHSPMSPQQMIDLAYVIFAKQPILQQDLRAWNRLPLLERTWLNMMTHFREAQTDLSSLPTAGDIFHQQPAAHQANLTTMVDLVTQRLLDEQSLLRNAYHPPYPAITAPPPPPPDDSAAVANSLQRRETDLQSREASMMSQMQDMMLTMMRNNNGTNTNNAPPQQRYTDSHSRGGRHSQGRGRGRTGRSSDNRSSTRLYCWTHGACAHTGVDCNRPSTGHQSTATFANMMAGSTTGCYWLT